MEDLWKICDQLLEQKAQHQGQVWQLGENKMLVKAVRYGSPVSYSSDIINNTGWESTLIIRGRNRFDHFLKFWGFV